MDPPAPPTIPATCDGTGRDGQPCRATPQAGKPWCPNHDPELRDRMADARRRGGEGRRKVGGKVGPSSEPAPAWVALATPGDVRAGYAWTVRAMVEKRLDPRAANAIGVLLAGAARAMDAAPVQLVGAEGTPAAEAPRVFLPAEAEDEDEP